MSNSKTVHASNIKIGMPPMQMPHQQPVPPMMQMLQRAMVNPTQQPTNNQISNYQFECELITPERALSYLMTARTLREDEQVKTNHRDAKQILPLVPDAQVREMVNLYFETRYNPRKTKLGHLHKLIHEIRHGLFVNNAQPIAFDKEGHLVDGQHRLLACVIANRSISLTTVKGVPVEIARTIGMTQSPRSADDTLADSGYTHTKTLQSAVRNYHTLFILKRPYELSMSAHLGHMGIFQFISENPDITISVSKCHALPRGIKSSLVAAIHYEASKSDPDFANSFVDKLRHGNDLSVTNPIFHLRNGLMARGAKMKTEVQAEFIIHAYNNCKMGKETTRMSSPKSFPDLFHGETRMTRPEQMLGSV